MRIIGITTKLNFKNAGGSSDENDLLFRSLQELGNTVTVITAYSSLNNIQQRPPYTLIQEDIRTKTQFGIQRGIFRLLRKYEKDADYFHVDGHIFLYGAGVYRLLGGKVPVAAMFNREQIAWPDNQSTFLSAAEHTTLYSRVKKVIRYIFEKYVLLIFANYIDFFEFTNPYLEQSYREFGLRTDGRSMIMGELLDWRKLMREQGITDERYTQRLAQEGTLTILYIGRMVPGKGFDLLIEAFSRVKEQDRFKVVFVGSGPEEKLLREMVEQKGLSRYITFAGYLPKTELYEMLKKTDIFIQPRWRNDMSSLSLLTAVVFGIPCIVPEGGGLAWMAGQGASTFADGDADDLARKIEEFGFKREKLLEISSGCFERLKDPILDHTNRATLLLDAMRKFTGK